MNMSLKTRLLVIGLALSVIPLVIVFIAVLVQIQKMVKIASDESTILAYSDLDHVADGIYSMCATQDALLRENIESALKLGEKLISINGGIALSQTETAKFGATDLPVVSVGPLRLTGSDDFAIEQPVVDSIKAITGAEASIFLYKGNDLIRVASTMTTEGGKRAIGTVMASDHPVTAELGKSGMYSGRARVLGQWLLASYKTITDSSGKAVGAFGVAVPQESVTILREAILKTKVGTTGYVYVLNGAGETKGEYVISAEGKRDGENIWEAKDADGNLFIQDIIEKAVKLAPTEVAEMKYPWKNEGDSNARMKVARLKYYEPWDWVIGVGSYEEEFYAARDNVQDVGRSGKILIGIVILVTLVVTTAVWLLVAGGVEGKISSVVRTLFDSSAQVTSTAKQVVESGQLLAQGTSTQASSLEETSASLEQMDSMTKHNADNTRMAKDTAVSAKEDTDKGLGAMGRLKDSMRKIKTSSDETMNIVRTIDEIAFQTNLLALNAAVEAARAGDQGRGFAVVAEEVRVLAKRSAASAKSTAELLLESQENAEKGVQVTLEVGELLDKIGIGVSKVTQLLEEVAAASTEQAKGIEQINLAVMEMDKVTQTAAASSEETASAAHELSAQAVELDNMVGILEQIVSGRASSVGTQSSYSYDFAGGKTRAMLSDSDRRLAVRDSKRNVIK